MFFFSFFPPSYRSSRQLFAGGDAQRCVFKVDGPRGGTGRGPVDVYNALVKVIREANARAVALGVPESELPRVQYFLAKGG